MVLPFLCLKKLKSDSIGELKIINGNEIDNIHVADFDQCCRVEIRFKSRNGMKK